MPGPVMCTGSWRRCGARAATARSAPRASWSGTATQAAKRARRGRTTAVNRRRHATIARRCRDRAASAASGITRRVGVLPPGAPRSRKRPRRRTGPALQRARREDEVELAALGRGQARRRGGSTPTRQLGVVVEVGWPSGAAARGRTTCRSGGAHRRGVIQWANGTSTSRSMRGPCRVEHRASKLAARRRRQPRQVVVPRASHGVGRRVEDAGFVEVSRSAAARSRAGLPRRSRGAAAHPRTATSPSSAVVGVDGPAREHVRAGHEHGFGVAPQHEHLELRRIAHEHHGRRFSHGGLARFHPSIVGAGRMDRRARPTLRPGASVSKAECRRGASEQWRWTGTRGGRCRASIGSSATLDGLPQPLLVDCARAAVDAAREVVPDGGAVGGRRCRRRRPGTA